MNIISKIEEGLTKIVETFEDANGYIHRTKVNEDGKQLHIVNEITSYLEVLNVKYKIEIIDSDCGNWTVLCLAFVVNGELGTYNIPVEED